MRLHWLGLLSLVIVTAIPFGVAHANRHENLCWANPDPRLCGLLDSPFSAILSPFDTIAPGFGMLFIWGPIVFGLYYKTKSPAIAGIFGIILVSVMTTLNPVAVGMGIVLIAISGGIGLIQVFQRIKQTV